MYNDVADDGHEVKRLYLNSDYDVSCGEMVDNERTTPASYKAMQGFAGIMIIVYVGGGGGSAAANHGRRLPPIVTPSHSLLSRLPP